MCNNFYFLNIFLIIISNERFWYIVYTIQIVWHDTLKRYVLWEILRARLRLSLASKKKFAVNLCIYLRKEWKKLETTFMGNYGRYFVRNIHFGDDCTCDVNSESRVIETF